MARQVLNISLPSSPGRIQELLREMQESIGQLEGVDAVLNSTAQGLAAARGLLAQGQDARQVMGDTLAQLGRAWGSIPQGWQGLELSVPSQGASRGREG